jgi:hypothetical protein
MENISQLSSDFCISVYDLKGSTYDRRVLKARDITSSSKTLKDTDFKNKETCLKIEKKLKTVFLAQIIKDARFFQKLGIIDYSMVLFKVDRSNEDLNNRLKQAYGENPQNNLKQLKCLDNYSDIELRTTYYHLGIIDYFQLYN